MSSYDIEIDVTYDNAEFSALIEYTVTAWGSSGAAASSSYHGDPLEPPEFEIDSIEIQPAPEKTIKLLWSDLSEMDQQRIDEAIYLQLGEMEYDDYPEPDFD
jgi:hypothetical protein